jgi:signal transduction histidine kinase/ActR/RegA family two-component response regulator
MLFILVSLSLVYVIIMHDVARRIRVEQTVIREKEVRLTRIPLKLAQLSAIIHNHDPRQPIDETVLIAPLDKIRQDLEELQSMPLGDWERAGVERLVKEERHFRTAAYAFANNAGRDPSGDLRSQILQQINSLTASTTDVARKLYESLAAAIEDDHRQLVEHLNRAVVLVAFATIAAVLVKIILTYVMGKALAVPLHEIHAATRQIGAGNLDHRINSPFKDIVGDLARGIDEMASRLQEAERSARDAMARLALQAEELRAARDAAEIANRAKTEFLANMSHEIRTPMTAILGFAELVGDKGDSEADRLTHVQTIRRNGEHLLALIDDILDLSKVEAGKMQITMGVCSVRKIAAEGVELLRGRGHERMLDLEVNCQAEVPDAVRTDPMRLRQILVNLAGNAVKFTEKGGVKILISAASGDTSNSARIQFQVTDTGIGMTPATIEKLFRPFSQADASVTRRFAGTGLGLSISKRLAQLLGGDITVASEPGRGSTFTLVIEATVVAAEQVRQDDSPSRRTDAAAAEAFSNNSWQIEGARILVVDDGPDNRRLVGHFLNKVGALADFADDGLAAIGLAEKARARGNPFDLILMDMQMPGMDGYAATARLCAAGHSTPIIALTAHAMDGDREKCMAAGCVDYIAKPIARDAFLEVVRRNLKRRSATAA